VDRQPDDTVDLVRRWHDGEPAALERLLGLHLPRLERYVRSKLEHELPRLRREGDSDDLIHSTVVSILQYGLRFVPRDGDQFQALLRRLVLNRIRNQLRAPRCRLRDASRERHPDSILDLRVASRSSEVPDRAAEKAEERFFARWSLEFLSDPEDRWLVALGAEGDSSWDDIGRELGVSADAARMRYRRLLPRLGNIIRLLKAGKLDSLLADESDP
jgi:DNA-directed RNA polymerase specialized sigma24 family protein